MGPNGCLAAHREALELRLLLLQGLGVAHQSRTARWCIRPGVRACLVGCSICRKCRHGKHPGLWRCRFSEVARLLEVPAVPAFGGLLARGAKTGARREAT